MSARDRQVEVERLKQLFVDAWRRIDQADGVYAAGFCTNECGQYMYPFVLSERGLEQAARKYIAKGLYTREIAADRLRWSIGDSPHVAERSTTAYRFDDQPDVFTLAPRDFAGEIHRRLKAAFSALQELDAQGLFGKGAQRESIVLLIEGGEAKWEFDSVGTLQRTLTGHAYRPRGIAVSPDGRRLATADSLSVILWNTADWSKVWTDERPIDRLDFDASGRLLVACCRYPGKNAAPKTNSLIDVRSGTVVREIGVEGHIIQNARFSPDGKSLACAMRLDREGYAGTNVSALVEIATGNVVDHPEADFEQVRDFAFLPHRQEIAVAVFGYTRRPLVPWKARGA